MSYESGTILGRLREACGDIGDDELFTDEQLNDYLSECNNVIGYAAARVLRRLLNDPALLRRKYEGFGRIDAATLATFQRNLLEQIRELEEAEMSTKTPVNASPEADADENAFSTDSDGEHRRTDLDTYLADQEELT